MSPEVPSAAISDGHQPAHRQRLGETTVADRTPINEYDALMQCAPGEEPRMAQDERQALRAIVIAASEHLTPEHRFVLEAIHAERLSYQQLADRMGMEKMAAWRLTKQAQAVLREILIQHPTIRGRIHMFSTWNEAARTAVQQLSPTGTIADTAAMAVIDRKIDQLRAIVHRINNDTQASDIAEKMRTIGFCAAAILDNMGAWSVDEMVDLLVRKQNDYGHANINTFGHIGIVVRTSDKVARYHNLANKQALAEPRVEALVDLVGYAAIAIMLEDGTFNLELDSAVTA